jgi:hypothetical protein
MEGLVRSIQMVADPNITIFLAACSTADGEGSMYKGPGGEGGFADDLRDHLSAVNIFPHIIAHSTAGHAFANPYARYFDGAPGGGVNGQWVIDPESPEWKLWTRALKKEKDDGDSGTLRFDYPFMSREEILARISA